MKKQHVVNLLILMIALSPIAYFFFVQDAIPETYISKFELNSSFEKLQTRNMLFTSVCILSIVATVLYLLMRNLNKVDPKVDEATPKSAFHKLGLIVTIFLVIVNYFFILSAQYAWVIDTRVVIAFSGLLIALIGNYMNNLKPNYIAGIRLPWTLNDPENWRQTHQLAGKLWFAGGLLLIVSGFAFPATLLRPVMITVIVVLVLVPCVYSYRLFRLNKNQTR